MSRIYTLTFLITKLVSSLVVRAGTFTLMITTRTGKKIDQGTVMYPSERRR